MGLTGILLAAGAGSRFGGGKLLHPLADGTLLGVAAARRLKAALQNCLAVIRAGDDVLHRLLAAEGMRVTICPNAERGMGTSLAWGVAECADADGWVVALADMPFLLPRTIRAVAHEIEQGAPLAAPLYRGRRGHPVGFGREFYAALVALDGDAGARALVMANQRDLVLIDCGDPGVLRDVDTRADVGG